MDEKRLPYYHRASSKSTCGVAEIVNSEKLVWLAAVSSPLLSPGSERAKIVRKKSKQRSIFALARRAKVSIEAEEPISPKVSCIGQVRTGEKSYGSAVEIKTDKRQQFRPASSSPGRILSNFRKQFKWASLFSLCRHTHHASPSCPAYGGSEVSRFGLRSYDSSSFCNPESCGTSLAKSLILLLECGETTQCISKVDVQVHASTKSKDGKENQNKILGHKSDNEIGSPSSCHIAAGNACDVESRSTLFALRREECKVARSSDMCNVEKNNFPTSCWEVQQQERFSVEVASEDLPCKDGENAGQDSALPMDGFCESEVRSSGEGCEGIVETLKDDITCKSVVSYISTVEAERSTCSNAEMPSCKASVQKWQGRNESGYEELKKHTITVIDKNQGNRIPDGTDRHDWLDHTFYHDVDHQGTLLGLNAIDHVLSRIPTLPQLSEKDLHCFLIGKDTDSVWDIHKAKRSEASCAQATLFVLDYYSIGNYCKTGASNRVTCSELWAVSFHEARGEAKFFRSHSATSYRAVIDLRRCKSEPRKPY